MKPIGYIVIGAVALIIWGVIYGFMNEANKPEKTDYDREDWWKKKPEPKEIKSKSALLGRSFILTIILYGILILAVKCVGESGIGDDEPYINDAHTYDRY